MFCHKCGRELPDDAAFCSTCGTRLLPHDSARKAPASTKLLQEETTADRSRPVLGRDLEVPSPISESEARSAVDGDPDASAVSPPQSIAFTRRIGMRLRQETPLITAWAIVYAFITLASVFLLVNDRVPRTLTYVVLFNLGMALVYAMSFLLVRSNAGRRSVWGYFWRTLLMVRIPAQAEH